MAHITDIITPAEIKSGQLLISAGVIDGALTAPLNYHHAANQIIALSEQIKAERATAAMLTEV